MIFLHQYESINCAILFTVVSPAANIALKDDLLNEWALGSILLAHLRLLCFKLTQRYDAQIINCVVWVGGETGKFRILIVWFITAHSTSSDSSHLPSFGRHTSVSSQRRSWPLWRTILIFLGVVAILGLTIGLLVHFLAVGQ